MSNPEFPILLKRECAGCGKRLHETQLEVIKDSEGTHLYCTPCADAL